MDLGVGGKDTIQFIAYINQMSCVNLVWNLIATNQIPKDIYGTIKEILISPNEILDNVKVSLLIFVDLTKMFWLCFKKIPDFLEVHTKEFTSPDRVAQLLRVSSWHTKVVGSIPSQGTYKHQLMSA